MKKPSCLAIPLCLLVWSATLCVQCKPAGQAGETIRRLMTGGSSGPVNPPMGAFIAGDRQNRRFTEVHDSLFAKAVVLYDGVTALAIVTVDCIGLLYPTINEIRERASAMVTQIPLPADHIVVTSTHTHSGPDVVGIWGTDYEHSGVDSTYMAFLVHTAAVQVSQAAQRLQPVRAFSAQTTFGEEWVQNICHEEIDRSVNILQFLNEQGVNVATLTNFACHPTYLDARYSMVSADYVGGFYRQLKEALPGAHLFLQGAIGGWVQPVDEESTPEKAYLRGEQLADVVIKALQQADTLAGADLRIRTLPVRFRLDNEAWKQLAAIGTIQRSFTDSVATELAWFSIGNAQFVTHPGETAPYFALESKKLMHTDGPKFVLGLGMDALGYILKPVFFENDSLPHAPYLTSMSVGKQTGPDLMAGLRKVIPVD